MQWTKAIRQAVWCLGILILLSVCAEAKFVPQVATEAAKDGSAYVLVNGKRVIYLKTWNGSLSPLNRANIAAERLIGQVQKGLDPKGVWYKQNGSEGRVMIGETLLVIASASEAKAQQTTGKSLAESWVRSIRQALMTPPLSAEPTALRIPVGESRTVTIQSLLTQPVQADVSNPTVISIDAQSKPGSLVVTGTSVGDAIITIRCEEYLVPVTVSVRKYAARLISPDTQAVVTGSHVPKDFVTRTAVEAARRAVLPEPGAKVSSLEVSGIVGGLAPGSSTQAIVRLEATGGDYIPMKAQVRVTVQNRVLSRTPVSWILYSNDPERVLKYQTLFAGQITTADEAVRLLYHHQNMMGRRIGFIVDVINPTNTDASLHVVEGISQPMIDTVIVGYKAGLEFIENERNCIGRVVEIPAGHRQVLVSQPLDHPYTASGIMQLRALSGGPLLVRVLAKPEEQRVAEDPIDVLLPVSGFDASKVALSDHVYPGPVKSMEVTYTAGKPWLFLRIGKEALKHATQEKQLYGNYGVTYDVKATLENPTQTPHSVEIAFEATAGPASGIFLVDGEMVRVKSLQPPREITIGRVTIPPGRNRIVSIQTIPLSGSAYPATIIIRPTGTLSSMSGAK